MKSLFTFTLALLAAASAWAQTTFTVDNLNYTVTDETTNTVELTGYETQPTGTLDIPATVTNSGTEYSVTNIGNRAFYYCSALTQVTIPESVESIGNSAFEGCSALTQVTIGNGMKSIGASAFEYCYALTEINIPNTVTSIENLAFAVCSALTQVILPGSVTSIGDRAFAYCETLTEIYVDETNTAYCSENGVLFNKGKTTLVCYPNGKPETTYVIPENVTSIGNYAFVDCSALTQVTLPENVTSIGEGAFCSCI